VILIVAAVLGLGTSLLRGGSWRHLADLRIRWGSVAVLALVIQVVAMRNGLDGGPILGAVILGSQALLIVVIWVNRHLDGFPILGAGFMLNLLAMAANGGFMPVSPESLARLAEYPAVAAGAVLPGSKSILLPPEATRFWILSDIFVLPRPFPIPTAFSLGDVLIAIGIVLIPNSMARGHRTVVHERPVSVGTERTQVQPDLGHGPVKPMLEQ